MTTKKKRNPADATMRNIRPLQRRIEMLEKKVAILIDLEREKQNLSIAADAFIEATEARQSCTD